VLGSRLAEGGASAAGTVGVATGEGEGVAFCRSAVKE